MQYFKNFTLQVSTIFLDFFFLTSKIQGTCPNLRYLQYTVCQKKKTPTILNIMLFLSLEENSQEHKLINKLFEMHGLCYENLI